LSDLVVVGPDFLRCTEDEIKAMEPLMTIVDGKIAYAR
jgi:predicted amidohydrolase YtcJ